LPKPAAETFQRILHQHVPLRFLSSNPLILTMIAEMKAAGSSELPSSRSVFYEQTVEHLWSRKAEVRSPTQEVKSHRSLQALASKLSLECLFASQAQLVDALEVSGVTGNKCDVAIKRLLSVGSTSQWSRCVYTSTPAARSKARACVRFTRQPPVTNPLKLMGQGGKLPKPPYRHEVPGRPGG
jgi:hypothetical protein